MAKTRKIRSRYINVPGGEASVKEQFQTEANIGNITGVYIYPGKDIGDFDKIALKDKNNLDIVPQMPAIRHRNNTHAPLLDLLFPVDVVANGDKITLEAIVTPTSDDREIYLELHYEQ